MYNSQYYTCEQIDQRLLQGYLDDYNTQTGQSLTKEQFLTKLGSVFAKETVIDNTAVNIGYFVCDTAAGTADKAVTAAGYELFHGGSIKVKFNNRNTAGSATLNINNKGAKALYYGGNPVSASNSWDNGEVVEIYYDGTNYYANNVEGNFKDGIFDISAYNLIEGQPTKYATLAEALGTNGNNIPYIFRKGGMQIKYVSTSDNKYVQYRFLLSGSFTYQQFANPVYWLSVEDEVLKQTGISVSQTAALVVSESSQKVRVNFVTSSKGTFKVAFDGGTSSALAIKVALYKDITNAQGFVYESGYFAFNQPIEYSGNEFNIAIFTVYANKVATAGDATVIINTSLFADIDKNKNAIEDAENKNISTMFYTKGYLLSGSATYDNNGLVVSSNIVWSDGVTGTLAKSIWDDRVLEYKRDVVTHDTQSIQYDRIYNSMGEVSKETITIN